MLKLRVLLVLVLVRLSVAYHIHPVPHTVAHFESDITPDADAVNTPNQPSVCVANYDSHAGPDSITHAATNGHADNHAIARTDSHPDARSYANH